MLFAYLEASYPKGIDNPFNTSGCEYLLFVCRCCLYGVRKFSYWFDNLGLITEGNTYATLLHHPFLFKGKPTHAQEVARRISGAVAGEVYAKSSQNLISHQREDFWRRCRGDLCTSQDIPSTYHKLLSLALHYLPFASRFPLPHFTLAVLFALFSVLLFFACFLCACVLDCLS